jgi:hypothetical protein
MATETDMALWRHTSDLAPETRRRRAVRAVAAAAAGVTAAMYLLIGLGVVSVVDTASADAPPLFDFGVAAGAAFALGALLLVATDRRILWVLGAVLQVGIIVMYVAVSPQRTPPFEMWGIAIKVLQLVLLGALAYLAVRAPQPATGDRGVRDHSLTGSLRDRSGTRGIATGTERPGASGRLPPVLYRHLPI